MRWRAILLSSSLLLGVSASVPAADAANPPQWRDSPTTRLEALALLQTLNADLLSHDSATVTLERWCQAHRLASPARVVAERVRDVDKAPSAEQRRLLDVSASEPVRYRRVRLQCGEHVLSEADNWYVPARLTAEMNRLLETTNISFGHVVASLKFQRHTLAADLLWTPLPKGWEMAPHAPTAQTTKFLQMPPQVLQHRAVLRLLDGTPFSALVETYTSEVLGFAEPPAPCDCAGPKTQ